MKKFCLIIAAIAIILIAFSLEQGTNIAYAMNKNGDEYDKVFFENVDKMVSDIYQVKATVIATKEALYDINCAPLGYVYDFTVNEEHGYAILIKNNNGIEMPEVFFDARCPYENVVENGYRIYAYNMLYLYKTNNDVFFAESNEYVSSEELSQISKHAYYSANEYVFSSSSETITFVSRQENKKELAVRYPALIEIANYSNACAPIAAGGIIQYWDRFYENLIPEYTPYTKIGNSYLYKEASETLNSVVIQLYNDMGTNSIRPGTSVMQFKTGVTAYCTKQGYSVNFNSCMTNGYFDYEKAKEKIDAGLPVVLFLDKFSVANINSGNDDAISYLYANGCHVMAGYGYKEINYVLSNNSNRCDRYISVGAGLSIRKRGYFNINYNTQIDDVFSVSIS